MCACECSSRQPLDADHGPGRIAVFVGREQNVYGGEFRWLAGTTHRRVGAEFGKLVRELSAARLQRRPDGSRRDRVYANSLLRELLGEPLGEDHDRALGGGVIDDGLVGIIGVDRTRGDDRRARFHMRQRRLYDPEHGIDVGLERIVELLSRYVEDRGLGMLPRGVAHEDVQAAQLAHGIRYEFRARHPLRVYCRTLHRECCPEAKRPYAPPPG